MPRALGIFLLVCAGCARLPPDYTPQIAVVPGAAARSLWIASKRPPAEEDAGTGPAEPAEGDAGAGGADP